MSDAERIAIVDLADDLEVRKQRIFKVLPRLGIRPTQRRDPSRGNQNVATVSQAEAEAIRLEIEKLPEPTGSSNAGPRSLASDDVGCFYRIQLEPEYDSGRFKLGFAMDLDGRLQKHRCSAPFSQYVDRKEFFLFPAAPAQIGPSICAWLSQPLRMRPLSPLWTTAIRHDSALLRIVNFCRCRYPFTAQ